MPRRTVLTERQRALLFDLPTDEVMLLRHYILSDGDVEIIQRRRCPENRLGFALQLCALRYPGRLLQRGEVIPEKVVAFIGAQLGLTGEQLLEYAAAAANSVSAFLGASEALWLSSLRGPVTAKLCKMAIWL